MKAEIIPPEPADSIVSVTMQLAEATKLRKLLGEREGTKEEVALWKALKEAGVPYYG